VSSKPTFPPKRSYLERKTVEGRMVDDIKKDTQHLSLVGKKKEEWVMKKRVIKGSKPEE